VTTWFRASWPRSCYLVYLLGHVCRLPQPYLLKKHAPTIVPNQDACPTNLLNMLGRVVVFDVASNRHLGLSV
jgi:hypothetical protein